MKRLTQTLAVLGVAALTVPACLSRPIELIEPKRSVVITEALTQSRVDKIDLLLAIDDSGSMADKQQILAVAVPDLVSALVNPPCLDPDGGLVLVPEGPLDECPEGSRREFQPVLDIHIGVISSSLGTRGSPWSACNDDGARLLNRLPGAGEQPTFEDKGFLVWEPEAELEQPGRYRDTEALNADLSQMVLGVGQEGCGHEAQLESWYRFLVEPDPHTEVELEGGRAVLKGTDEVLLAERRAFLRPDSLVAIIMLSDENDCSFRSDGYGYYTTGNAAGRGIMGLVPRSECATAPNDPCCAPCGHEPEQCPTDPKCEAPELGNDEQLLNLTCFEQKRRYGIDLLHPTSRYVAALTQTEIEDRRGEVQPNPLMVSPEGLVRGKDRVFLAGIVGVPWQLIARDPMDLEQGFMNKAERDERGVWDVILGNPAKHHPPSDPHMVESIHPRPGLPGVASEPNADPLHGHEYQPNTDRAAHAIGDLQYACTFELPEPIVCDATFSNCDCKPGHSSNNPLCQAADGSYGTTQYRAKAYPGLRQLSVLEGLGSQGIVGSICPAQLADAAARDYGYLPAIGAIIERLKQELSGPCLARSFTPNADKQVACIVLEGRALADAGGCSCDAAGRAEVAAVHQQAVVEAMEKPSSKAVGLNCFCEIEQLEGEELEACQYSLEEEPRASGELVHGWCYVDATTDREIGDERLVDHCQVNERRTIRFVNEGEPVNDAHVFITCQQ